MRRREVLVGAGRGMASLALIALTTGTAAAAVGCSRDTEPEVDPLQQPYEMAAADADLARSAATAAKPALAQALTQIASERAQHAQALAEELSRASGRPVPATTTASSTAEAEESGSDDETPTSTSPPPPPPSAADVATALRRSAENAATLAATESGYRAGLLASIAAACTASYRVTLPDPKAAS